MILAMTVMAMIPAVIPAMTAMAMMITWLLSSSNAMACNQVVFGCDTDSMFSVTRRSRSDVSESVSQSVSQ